MNLTIGRTNKWYATMKLIEILASVISSIMYVHFAAFRYDVDIAPGEEDHAMHMLAPNLYATEEEIKKFNIY